MIDKATALETLLRRAKALETGHCLDVRTYKRNRSVIIQRTGQDSFVIVEEGYENQIFRIETKRLKKLLKTLLKREFPRSTKIRLYALGPCNPEHRREMKTL